MRNRDGEKWLLRATFLRLCLVHVSVHLNQRLPFLAYAQVPE